MSAAGPVRIAERYALYDEIGAGGMAKVHLARVSGGAGFARTVAIKRMHTHLAAEPDFIAMFVDEARLASRVRHPNVVSTLDVVATPEELLLVMEYVHGESLARLLRAAAKRDEKAPIPVVLAILVGVLHGLHAAHEATDEQGTPLHIVHRDVSPQNILVGVDGVARLLDFGVAKAKGRLRTTKEGRLRGKVAYMAPEQIGGMTSRAADIYAASVVLWEALAGQRFVEGENDAVIIARVASGMVAPPSAHRPEIPPELDEVVAKALEREPEQRYATALDMARALEHLGPAPISEVASWVSATWGEGFARRTKVFTAVESQSSDASGSRRSLDSITPEPSVSPRAPRPPSRRRAGLVAAAVLALLGIGAAAQIARARIGSPPAPAPPPQAPPVVAEATPVAAELSADPPAPAPAAIADPAPGLAPHAAASVRRKAHHLKPGPVLAPARASCDDPIAIDPVTGDHHYKRECLK